MAITTSSYLGFKVFNMKTETDPDSIYPITKGTNTLSLSTDFSLVTSLQSVVGSSYTPVSASTTLTPTSANSPSKLSSYNSTGVWDIADPPPAPPVTPVTSTTSVTSVTPTTPVAPVTPTTPVVPVKSEPNSTYTTSTETKASKYTTGGVAFFTFAFSVLNSMSQGGSLQSFWTLINDYQLYQTILLLGAYVPDKLVDFFSSFSFSTCSFSFLNDLLPFKVGKILSGISENEAKKFYVKVGLKYNSMIANQIFLLLMLVLIMISDLLLFPFYWYWAKHWNGMKKKIASYWLNFYRFKIYIRLAAQSFLFVLIGGNNEINYYLNGGKLNYFSSSFALLYMTAIVVFLVFVVLHYLVTSWRNQISHIDTYCKELYADVRPSKYSRAYSTIYFIRRLFISWWVVFSVDRFGIIIVLSSFSLIQFINLVYKVVVRPFKLASSNFIEILGDTQFFLISSFLIFFHTQEKWTNTITYTVMGSLVATKYNFIYLIFC